MSWNGVVGQGKDEFGKTPKYRIEKGPFYAVTVIPFIHTRFGGLRINDKCQVLDIDSKIIPGLYAAGTATGGCFGDIRPTAPTVVGLTPMSVNDVFGTLAGKNAAAEKSV